MANDFYRGLLGRLMENNWFFYWLERFKDGQCRDDQSIMDLALEIVSSFIFNPEYRNRDDLGYVEDLFDAIMRRMGDWDGVNHSLTGLGDGTYTRDGLLWFFTNTPEYQDRVQDFILSSNSLIYLLWFSKKCCYFAVFDTCAAPSLPCFAYCFNLCL